MNVISVSSDFSYCEIMVKLMILWWDLLAEAIKLLILVYHVQIQLIRIELRVPEYGWTTQKVFHLMNFIVNGGDRLKS